MKKVTAIKKASGPNTERGKLISSQNAIKTGLTAKQLLNEQEFTRFSEIKKNLSNYFSGENPLISLQIEKIARLQIQLERIQNGIDALYRKSEMNPPRQEHKNSSPRDSATIGLYLNVLLGFLDEAILSKIESVLLTINLQKLLTEPTSKNDSKDEGQERPAISQSSLLGAYLFAEANYYRQDVSSYLKDKNAAIANTRNSKELYQKLNFEVLNSAIDLMNSPNLEEVIVMDDHYEFYLFKSWFEKELTYLPEQINELRLLMQQKENPIHVVLPNFDDLDRMVRYQTTISRQLSTAIGELRILAA
jgi:hypothetical protein